LLEYQLITCERKFQPKKKVIFDQVSISIVQRRD